MIGAGKLQFTIPKMNSLQDKLWLLQFPILDWKDIKTLKKIFSKNHYGLKDLQRCLITLSWSKIFPNSSCGGEGVGRRELLVNLSRFYLL